MVRVNNMVAIAVFILLNVIVVVLALISVCNFAKLDANSKYRAHFDGTKID